jgi:hypothetical protein
LGRQLLLWQRKLPILQWCSSHAGRRYLQSGEFLCRKRNQEFEVIKPPTGESSKRGAVPIMMMKRKTRIKKKKKKNGGQRTRTKRKKSLMTS